ncbi:hypothetical protein PFISCL1PPCAC_10029, partial [Pristionchus fissidentatus]
SSFMPPVSPPPPCYERCFLSPIGPCLRCSRWSSRRELRRDRFAAEREQRRLQLEERKRERERDNHPSSLSIVYSRRCGICLTENPRVRAVFTGCGHCCCIPCAEDHHRTTNQMMPCPFCRTRTSFIRLFENSEEGNANSPPPDGHSLLSSFIPHFPIRHIYRFACHFVHTLNPLSMWIDLAKGNKP